MPWFKVDDHFHSHPKVLRAGNAAVGLYVRCGAWSSDNLTDGFIPSHVVDMFGTDEEAAALVSAALWKRHRHGFVMRDFLEYNPSAERVKAKRAADAERQRKGRVRQMSQRDSQRDGSVSHSVSPTAVTVVPTRPVTSTSIPPTTETEAATNGHKEGTEKEPSTTLDATLDLAAQLVVKHREQQGWGPPGPRAITKARSELDQVAGQRWLNAGHDTYRVAQALMARLCDGVNARPPT